MSKFITLHYCIDNRLLGVSVEDIAVAAIYNNETKSSQVYIDGDEDNFITVNEKPSEILKRIGDTRKFIMVHSKTSNNEIILPVDTIITVKEATDKGCKITIGNTAFESFDVNETVTTVITKLNED
jgi:hypothetical protein